MSGEWEHVSLDQLYDFSSGLSKPRSEFGSGYPFLSFKNVFYNIFVPNELTELVNSTEHERLSRSIKRGDVFLTRTSETIDELGMSCVALKDLPGATFNGFTKRLRPKSSTAIVPEYAAYFFRSPTFRREVTQMSSLSTRASLNNAMLARLSVAIPPFADQVAIGRILKALDDKIELNRRMNGTLEDVARALFKSWFVDFDPVHVKPALGEAEGAEGRRPYGMDADTAALFPNTFDDSPLGEVPTGWAVRRLGDVTEKPQYGFTASAQSKAVGPRFLRITDINKVPWIDWSSVPYCHISADDYQKYRVQESDLLIARMADPGHGVMIEDDVEAVFASYLIRFRPRNVTYGRYLQYWLRSDSYWSIVAARSSGSTRASLNAKVLAAFDVLVPPEAVVRTFGQKVDALRSKLTGSVGESGTLAALRDALLPKLISGELRVKDADKVVAAAI